MTDDEDNVVRPSFGRVLFEVGGVVDQSSAALCIYGDALDPDTITARLGTSPTRAFRKGHRVKPTMPPAKHGAWILDVRGKAPAGPEDHLRELLMRIAVPSTVWSEVVRDYRVRISCSVHMTGWNRGFALSPAIIKRVADLGVELDFDLYAYDEEEGDG